MYIKGTEPGEPIPWYAHVESFYIHSVSPEEYDKVISPWGEDISFKAERGEDTIKWTVTGGGNVPTLPDGRTVTFGKIGKDGKNPVEPGEYKVKATDKNGLTDDMTLLILKIELKDGNTIIGDDDFAYINSTPAMPQLKAKLKPNEILIGEIERNSALYELLHKYIRHIYFGERSDNFEYSYKFATLPKHFYYNLLSQYLCAL